MSDKVGKRSQEDEKVIQTFYLLRLSFPQQAATDPFAFQQMMKELLKFSLVKRLVGDRVLSIHRLVQTVQVDMMEQEEQRQWAERVVRAINALFPDDPQNMAT